jgi:molybdopterin molybdotransferase
MRMRAFGALLPLEEARRRTLAAVRPITVVERLPLDDALGRVAAATVRASAPVPAFRRATWDGYALRSRDVRSASRRAPVRLRLVGDVFAEDASTRRVGPGEAAAIATGGAVPDGADAVEIFEDLREAPGEVELTAPVARGARIAPPGDDYPRGAVVVARGQLLTPAALGGLAETGHPEVPVLRRPTVAVLPNGNELVDPGERLRPGQVHESNNRTLGAVIRASGCDPLPLAPVVDDPDRIEAALRRADAVLATGGSSVGEHDYLPTVFPRIGRLLYHGVAVRPGKPTLAARAGGKLLLGMPGHPTSCLSNAYWLLLPTLRRLAGLPGPGWIDGEARLAAPAGRLTAGLSTVVPLRAEGDRAWPTFHGSSAITSLAGVNAFAILPPGRGSLPSGRRLGIHRLLPPLAGTV